MAANLPIFAYLHKAGFTKRMQKGIMAWTDTAICRKQEDHFFIGANQRDIFCDWLAGNANLSALPIDYCNKNQENLR